MQEHLAGCSSGVVERVSAVEGVAEPPSAIIAAMTAVFISDRA